MAIELHEFMLKAEQNLRFWDNKKKSGEKQKTKNKNHQKLAEKKKMPQTEIEVSVNTKKYTSHQSMQ